MMQFSIWLVLTAGNLLFAFVMAAYGEWGWAAVNGAVAIGLLLGGPL